MKVLLIDDHQMFVDGLKGILVTSDASIKVEAVHNGRDALKKLLSRSFDIALVDLRLPIMDGFALLDALAQHNVLTPVIVVSASRDPEDMNRAIALGAMSFIPKSSSGQQIIQTIHDVMAGKVVYTPHNELGYNSDFQLQNEQWASLHNLTTRQLEVLRLIRKGLSNQDIATQLNLSVTTIKTHVAAIFAALDAQNRTESGQKAHQLGLD